MKLLFLVLFQCKNADEAVKDRGGPVAVRIGQRQAAENR